MTENLTITDGTFFDAKKTYASGHVMVRLLYFIAE